MFTAGLACLIGLITSVSAFLGGDAPAHLAEEVKSASKILPRAMITATIINGSMGLIILMYILPVFFDPLTDKHCRTFLYTMGDIVTAITSSTGYPIIQVFYGATGSAAGATALSSLLVILNIAAVMSNTAGASRQMFAFARDRGLPFSRWISRVPSGYDVPVNAIILSTTFACVLLCINIGSNIGFNIITSIGTVALITSYMTSIGCVTLRRLRGQPLLESPFAMGRLGLVVNILSLMFLMLIFVFAFFPPVPNPPATGMNWAIVVYVGMLAVGGFYYVLRARHVYDGPVEYVRKSV
jgi:choline transport protein